MSLQLINQPTRYGWISIGIHWLSAVTVISLFSVGLYMTSLTYYDPLYKILPYWHKSIGILFGCLLLFRILWRWLSPPPALLSQKLWERYVAHLGHLGLYVLMVSMIISGYFISTADGRPITVFDWFEIPATITDLEDQEDWAGEVHEILAFSLIGLVVIHALAAFKQWLIDKDATLIRMLRPGKDESITLGER